MMAIVPFLIVAALGICMLVWHLSRAGTLVQQWADRNGYTLISAQRRMLRRGPFWWRTGKTQEVYRITVLVNGQQRSGYLRVGGMFLGLLSDQANVEWD